MGEDTDAGIENFQEALRLFPPFRDDDGYTFGAVEVPCPDCDAVFSSAYVLYLLLLWLLCELEKDVMLMNAGRNWSSII